MVDVPRLGGTIEVIAINSNIQLLAVLRMHKRRTFFSTVTKSEVGQRLSGLVAYSILVYDTLPVSWR
jgi:hypothetical protein